MAGCAACTILRLLPVGPSCTCGKTRPQVSTEQARYQHGDAHALLKHIPLFTPLDDSEVAALALQMKTHLFRSGEVIVKQGDVGASMYIVAEGLLSVSVNREESADAIQVNQLIPGEFFGEISLLTGEPRTATVKAAVNALVCEITKEAMELILEKRLEIAAQLPQNMRRFFRVFRGSVAAKDQSL
jgi:CRP-like cAMP-binding protein